MKAQRPGRIILAAAAYWAIVFAVGFALGAVRTLLVEPEIGRLAAVLIELPLMLTASWLAARWTLARFAIDGARAALLMGAAAFVLLMASEAALTLAMPNTSPAQWLADLASPAGLVGLGGQVIFGLMPWLLQSGLARR